MSPVVRERALPPRVFADTHGDRERERTAGTAIFAACLAGTRFEGGALCKRRSDIGFGLFRPNRHGQRHVSVRIIIIVALQQHCKNEDTLQL